MDVPSFVAGVVTGIVGLIVIMSVFVPDPIAQMTAMWVVTRRNFPTMILPIGIILLVLGLGAFAIVLYVAIKTVSVAPWVWISTSVGIVIIAVWLYVRRRNHQQRS